MNEHAHNLGARLAQARENAKLSTSDVANELRLTVSVVEIIESNQFEAGPAPTFLRGYIRSYAKLVKISDDEITQALIACGLTETNHREASPAPELSQKPRDINTKWLKVAGYFFIIIILTIIAITWHKHQPKTMKQTSKLIKRPAMAMVQTHHASVPTESQEQATALSLESGGTTTKPAINTRTTNPTISAALPEQGLSGHSDEEDASSE